jgi:hypothetical protein
VLVTSALFIQIYQIALEAWYRIDSANDFRDMSCHHLNRISSYLVPPQWHCIEVEQLQAGLILRNHDTGSGVLARLLSLSCLLGPTIDYPCRIFPNTILRAESFAFLAYV